MQSGMENRPASCPKKEPAYEQCCEVEMGGFL
jgi:hypothetical protein